MGFNFNNRRLTRVGQAACLSQIQSDSIPTTKARLTFSLCLLGMREKEGQASCLSYGLACRDEANKGQASCLSYD